MWDWCMVVASQTNEICIPDLSHQAEAMLQDLLGEHFEDILGWKPSNDHQYNSAPSISYQSSPQTSPGSTPVSSPRFMSRVSCSTDFSTCSTLTINTTPSPTSSITSSSSSESEYDFWGLHRPTFLPPSSEVAATTVWTRGTWSSFKVKNHTS